MRLLGAADALAHVSCLAESALTFVPHGCRVQFGHQGADEWFKRWDDCLINDYHLWERALGWACWRAVCAPCTITSGM